MAKGKNLIPIPGELNSIAIGGVVAAAESIKDYKQNKTQEKINEEVLANISALSQDADISKVDLQNKVDNANTNVATLISNVSQLQGTVATNKTDADSKINDIEANISALETKHTTDISNMTQAANNTYNSLNAKIDAKVIAAGGVTFDNTPTINSGNPVTSGGIYNAIKDNVRAEDVGTVVPDIEFNTLTDTVHTKQQSLTTAQKAQAVKNLGIDIYNQYNDTDLESGWYITNTLSVGDRFTGIEYSSPQTAGDTSYRRGIIELNKGGILTIYGANFLTEGNLYLVVSKNTGIVLGKSQQNINALTNKVTITATEDSWVYVSGAVTTLANNQQGYIKLEVINGQIQLAKQPEMTVQYGYVSSVPSLDTVNRKFTLPNDTNIWYKRNITLNKDVSISYTNYGQELIVYSLVSNILYAVNIAKNYIIPTSDIPIALIKWNTGILEGNFVEYSKDGAVVQLKNVFDTDIQSLLASKGMYLHYDHLCNYASNGKFSEYKSSTNFDSIWVKIPDNVKTFTLYNVDTFRVNYFSVFGTPNADTFISYTNDVQSEIPGNAKMISVTVPHTADMSFYNKVDYVFGVPTEGYSIAYNHLCSINTVDDIQIFQGYVSSTLYDNIQVVLPKNCISFSIKGIPSAAIVRYVYFNSYSIGESSFIGYNSTGVIMDNTVLVSVTVNGNALDGYQYDNLDVTFVTPSDEINEINRLMKVIVSDNGNNLMVRTNLSDENDIIITMKQYTSSIISTGTSNCLSFSNIYVGSKLLQDSELTTSNYLVHSPTDSIGAISINSFYYLYAQHGYAIVKWKFKDGDLMANDINSIWKNDSGKNFTLVYVDTVNLYAYFAPVIHKDVEAGYEYAEWSADNGYFDTLTHVSGGISTGTITGTSSRYDISIQDLVNRKYICDGNTVEDGVYYCDDFVVSECLKCHNVSKIANWLPNTTYDGDTLTLTRNFTFKGSSVAFNQVINTEYPFKINRFYGCIPQLPFNKDNYRSMTYIPKAKSCLQSINPSMPFQTSSDVNQQQCSIYRSEAHLYDINKMPDRIINVLYNPLSGKYLAGLASGVSLVKGISTDEYRNTQISVNSTTNFAATFGNPANKFYPRVLTSEGFKNGLVDTNFIKEFSCYYHWFDPNKSDKVNVFWYKDGSKYIIYIHTFVTVDKATVTLPAFMEGMTVDSIVENSNNSNEFITNTVINNTLYVNMKTNNNLGTYIVGILK